MSAFQNLTNEKFTYLTVRKLSDRRDKSGRVMWVCDCRCGNEVIVSATSLKTENTRSCGCLAKEKATIHGLSKTPEYAIYKAMIARCYDKTHPEYHNYGGRGITVCDEWRESFEAFYRDMCPRPASNLTLDREKNDQGYSKANCRWITQADQNNNKRDNILHTYLGEEKTLPQWCRAYGLNYKTAKARFMRGWKIEDIITTPAQAMNNSGFTINGETKSLKEWCDKLNLFYPTIHKRLQRGMLFEEAVGIRELKKNYHHALNGTTKTIGEWCDLANLKFHEVCCRLFSGWTFEEAIQPIESKLITYDTITKSLRDWCDVLGLDLNNTCLRILRGELFGSIVEE